MRSQRTQSGEAASRNWTPRNTRNTRKWERRAFQFPRIPRIPRFQLWGNFLAACAQVRLLQCRDVAWPSSLCFSRLCGLSGSPLAGRAPNNQSLLATILADSDAESVLEGEDWLISLCSLRSLRLRFLCFLLFDLIQRAQLTVSGGCVWCPPFRVFLAHRHPKGWTPNAGPPKP